MRDYGKVSPQFWIGATGRRLRGALEAQIVAAYLVTGPPAHPLGIYYLPIPTIAHDTGLTIAGATKGLRRVIQEGFASYDEPSSYVYVPEMARFQVAETMKPGDKRHGWVIDELIRVKITSFVAAFVAKYGVDWQLDQGREYPTIARVIEGASIPHRSKEQEQEQDVTEWECEAPPTNPLFAADAAEKNTAHARVAEVMPDDDGFEEFYAAYPKKKAPEKAQKAWRKLGPDEQLQAEILAAIAAQKLWPEWRKDGGQFIPYPATWLNGRMWQDEPTSPVGFEFEGSQGAVARVAQRRLG